MHPVRRISSTLEVDVSGRRVLLFVLQVFFNSVAVRWALVQMCNLHRSRLACGEQGLRSGIAVPARLWTIIYRLASPVATTIRGMLGEELRRIREKAGITQEELSFRAGVDRSYISQLEHDKKSPTVDTLFRICDALGASTAQLVARVERRRK